MDFLKIFTGLILVTIFVYGVHEAIPLIAGPQLTVTAPKNSESFYNGFMTISGTAVHTKSVSLDGGPLLTDQYGHFETTLTLPRGGAILTLTATDRFGRTVEEQRSVFVN